MTAGVPSPDFQGPGPDEQYHAYLAAGDFRVQRCADCGAYQFYPRVLCRSCGSAAVAFVPVSGAAQVYSHTTVRNKPERGGDYNVALVELAEGPRLFSRVDGIGPEAVTIGMPLRARIVTEGERTFVVFDPA